MAVLCVVVAGCGEAIDEEAWRADVEAELGQPVADWKAYRDVWLETCDEDDTGFGFFVAAALDGGNSIDELRMNVRFACPERLEDVEETVAGIENTRSSCSIPEAERTDEQARLAEAMGC